MNFLYSYFQSGSSGCLRSHNGRRLLKTGSTGKLYAGGGEGVDLSKVHASHGSLPARSPLKTTIGGSRRKPIWTQLGRTRRSVRSDSGRPNHAQVRTYRFAAAFRAGREYA